MANINSYQTSSTAVTTTTTDPATPLSDNSVTISNDPLVGLLLARLCIDFEQSLTRNIYQFCEQALVITKDRAGESTTNLDTDYSNIRANSLKDPNSATRPTYDTGSSSTLPDTYDGDADQFDILNKQFHGKLDYSPSFTFDNKHYSDSWHSTAQVLAQSFIKQIGLK